MSAFPSPAGFSLRFRSKIDIWLGSALLAASLSSGTVALALLLQKGLASLALLPMIAAGLAAWVLADTWYAFTDRELIVHCGPFRTAVPLAGIRTIRAASTALSAPALSLDRLEIAHAGGVVIVSPADREGFIRALRTRHPAAAVIPGSPPTAGQERLLKWSLSIVPIAVAATIVSVLGLGTERALRVDVTTEAVTVHGDAGTSVPLADVLTVSLVDTLPDRRELGDRGRAYVTRDTPPFIVARTRSGLLVLNTGHPARTRRLFAEIQSALATRRRGGDRRRATK